MTALRDYHNTTNTALTAWYGDEDDAQNAYDTASDLAIQMIANTGNGPDDHDRLDQPLSDDVQTLLQLAFQRHPALVSYVSDLIGASSQPSPGATVEPRNHLPLRAFNLTPGASFLDDDHPTVVWTVSYMSRTEDEHVHVWCHDNGDETDTVSHRSFVFHYCDTVRLVGITANPTDDHDNDWGYNL